MRRAGVAVLCLLSGACSLTVGGGDVGEIWPEPEPPPATCGTVLAANLGSLDEMNDDERGGVASVNLPDVPTFNDFGDGATNYAFTAIIDLGL